MASPTNGRHTPPPQYSPRAHQQASKQRMSTTAPNNLLQPSAPFHPDVAPFRNELSHPHAAVGHHHQLHYLLSLTQRANLEALAINNHHKINLESGWFSDTEHLKGLKENKGKQTAILNNIEALTQLLSMAQNEPEVGLKTLKCISIFLEKEFGIATCKYMLEAAEKLLKDNKSLPSVITPAKKNGRQLLISGFVLLLLKEHIRSLSREQNNLNPQDVQNIYTQYNNSYFTPSSTSSNNTFIFVYLDGNNSAGGCSGGDNSFFCSNSGDNSSHSAASNSHGSANSNSGGSGDSGHSGGSGDSVGHSLGGSGDSVGHSVGGSGDSAGHSGDSAGASLGGSGECAGDSGGS